MMTHEQGGAYGNQSIRQTLAGSIDLATGAMVLYFAMGVCVSDTVDPGLDGVHLRRGAGAVGGVRSVQDLLLGRGAQSAGRDMSGGFPVGDENRRQPRAEVELGRGGDCGGGAGAVGDADRSG